MRVLIYGASGWTGRLAAAAVAGRGLEVVLGGRDRDRLGAVAVSVGGAEVRAIAGADRGALAHAMAGVGVVINCTGPSEDLGVAVIDAAIASGVDYLDVSGEHSFVRRVYGTRDGAALGAGVVVAPAFAAKGALGDWAASILAGARPAAARQGDRAIEGQAVAVAYAHTADGFVRPSLGSALSAAGQGFVPLRAGSGEPRERAFGFPPPFGRGVALRVPGAEDISIPRHLAVREAVTYIAIEPGGAWANHLWMRVIRAAVPMMPMIARAMLSVPGRRGLGATLREPIHARRPSFAAAIEHRRGRARSTQAILARDAYGVTAEIVALGAERLLCGPRPRPGVLAPSELCDPVEALRALERRGAVVVLRTDDDALTRDQTWS